ncbi:lactate utilization protein A [Sideroxyarcus emersonii]|uniref:Lactate utilization protein A n=1 Tax=Sideroxyarcus emersonii TaxID=2764705 RepID=A0AAN2BZK1_9PROT|nr:(Fe-S)-binding protein [Sideroxyarcus emersonii]BCK88161.1 lactate utilization protein A [Sideroxyarcus emersonii]
MRVGFFVTCLVDTMRPSIGFASLKLLEAAGCEVIVPEHQTCCGQPGYNSGDHESARAMALKFLAEFEAFDYVVLPSGSCAGMVRVHYPDLFKNDPDLSARFAALAQRTYELTDFLHRVARLEKAPGTFRGTVTYHDSCSGLRELDVYKQPRALLATMPDVKLQEMVESTTCCGFGGTFSLKYGELSTRMADNKCQHITAAGADAIVGGDLGCLLNIEGRLRRTGDHATRVLHVAEVLSGEEK